MTSSRPGRKIRVLVVDDSALARKYLTEGLERSGDIEVAGQAASGQEALAKAATLLPDLVLLDIVLPDMHGDEVAAALVAARGLPVVAMTSLDDPTLHERMRRAGAHAVWVKQGFSPAHLNTLVTLIREAVQANRRENPRSPELRIKPPYPLVVIVSSTGGPPIVRSLLHKLSVTFSAPVVVVQHIVESVLCQTRQWLEEATALRVVIAEPGMVVKPGVVYLLPADTQLVMGQFAFRRAAPSRPAPYRPSADLFLESAARVFGRWTVAVILSGMGKDGASGARQIVQAGGIVVVQDPEEAPIPSMPRAVLRLHLPCTVLRAREIPPFLVRTVSRLSEALQDTDRDE